MTGPWRVVSGEAGALQVYVTPAPATAAAPAIALCHELPRPGAGSSDVARAYPALADRLADECGCRVIAAMLRGTGGSEGDFSAAGWLADLAAVIDSEVPAEHQVWLVGFGLGGAVALRAATAQPRVCGVASVAGPADLAAWAANADRILDRCRRAGAITTPGFPADVGRWAAELVALAPLDAAARLGGRPLLVMHGSDDTEVATAAARAIADAASPGSPVDLRIVPGAGHWLRADPRVVATLVGWIERRS